MGGSPQCYIPSFMKISPPVLEKMIFEGFYHIAFIQNLVQNGPVVSEKIRFKFLYVHDLGQRSSNDLDLQYSHTFMKSISYLYLPTFGSQASIVFSEKSTFTFSLEKPVSKFDLAVK